MVRLIPIDDPEDERVGAYRDVRERDLVGREGLFIAEGEVVLNVAIRRARHRVISLLLAEKRAAAMADLMALLPAEVPVYVASQAVMDGIAGFHLHRGILALGRREAELPVDGLLAGIGTRGRVVALFGIANHDNMGGIFRNAAAFGTDEVAFETTSDALPGVTRSFGSFSAAAKEAGMSRIYGGIHWAFDNEAGLACGKKIAEHAARHHFRPAAAGPGDRISGFGPRREP